MEGRPSHSESKKEVNFGDLPNDVLFSIFRCLDVQNLSILACVSKRLYHVINDEYLSFKSLSLLVTNQFSDGIRLRSWALLSSVNKYRTNVNWRKKRYNERIFLKTTERYRPWLQLSKDTLYISEGKNIFQFHRNETGILKRPFHTFSGHLDDVSRFVVKENLLVSGGSDGMLCGWNLDHGKNLFHKKNKMDWCENLYVDFSQGTVVTGYSTKMKILRVCDERCSCQKEFELGERVWCIAVDEGGDQCAVGSSGHNGSPLKVYDTTRYSLVHNLHPREKYKYGAGVFDVKWESPDVLVSGGFDTVVRMWDLRTGSCVRSWEDPFDAAVYSLATDYMMTIMAGTATHGRVTLWDKRHAKCVQVYYMSESRNSGPVYSLDFDPSCLFVALDTSLHVLDFSKKIIR